MKDWMFRQTQIYEGFNVYRLHQTRFKNAVEIIHFQF